MVCSVKSRVRASSIVIFGDGPDQAVSKAVWSALAGHDIRLIKAHSLPLDAGVLEGAHLTIVLLKNMENIEILEGLGVQACPIIAIINTQDVNRGAELFGRGCDVLLTTDCLGQSPDFRQILLANLKKGQERQKVLLMAEEGRLLNAAIDNSPESFILFDADRKLTYVSTHFKKAYPNNGHKLLRGIDAMETFELGRTEHGLNEDDPQYQSIYDFWQRLDGQMELELKEGRIWRIIARKLPGNLGTMVTTTDITKYVRQQREIEQKSRDLAIALEKEKEASEIQKQFINMVSHEFRTPLSIIDGNAQLLQRRAATADLIDKDILLQRTRIMRSAVSRLVGMMEGVLFSNMLKIGKMQLAPETFDIKILIDDLCQEYQDLSNIPEIERVYSDLPETVHFDRCAMMLILGNLLANAVKFSRGAPLIHVRASLRGGNLEISVKDNGIGIPENEQSKVFARYYRASTAAGVSGTGIGLSLVKELAEMQGGSVVLESKAGEGTIMVVRLPLRHEE